MPAFQHRSFSQIDPLRSARLDRALNFFVRTRRYRVHFALLGSPIYSEGELFIDSTHRFKGQSAPCIIFTEIDFVGLDDVSLRKLFVGMTRATMKLVMVVSERAAEAMLERVA